MTRISLRFVPLCLLTCVIAAGPATPSALAQTRSTGGGIDGRVTTQSGTIQLGGARVVLIDSADREVAMLLTEGDGQFHFTALPPATYHLLGSLDGFETKTIAVVVTAEKSAAVTLDLPLAAILQTVDVVGTSTVVSTEGTLAPVDTMEAKERDQYAPGGGLQGALRLLASIIEVPGGVSIKGGRPSQASVQLGPTTLVNPTTGLTHVSLPDDAIESVAVLPNPYAVEYGRFSSGLVIIRTRRASDEWRLRLNNMDPTFRTRRGSPFHIKGIGSFGPRIETGGPIVKDRLFLEQTAQYRYSSSDVPSRPEDELRTEHTFSSFTRSDANLSPRHSLAITGGVFPVLSKYDTLGTFTPPDATIDLHANAGQVGFTERALWTDTIFTEATVSSHGYETDVVPQGPAAMQLRPDTTLGNYFNRQHRHTRVVQAVGAMSGSRQALGGLHLFRIGVDLLHSRYTGSSASRPVLVRRVNGTLARRLDYPLLALQSIASTDVALFAQDRFQPNTRWFIEFGGRVDHDGVVGSVNLTPRVGTAVLLNESGSAVLRGGFGLFYERTPSIAGAFEQFEAATDTRFKADGTTPIGSPALFRHRRESLDTPRSRTWDIGYDHRLNKMWAFHVGAIDRNGSRELIVEPRQLATSNELRLSSTGRSRYREIEGSVHFTRAPGADFQVTYARSSARGDLNALTNYFDTILWPVIGANEYARANADSPNRVLARGRVMPTPRWLVVGILDWRSGRPYSLVNEALDFVGPRNTERFPTYARVELGIEHRFKIFGHEPWIGVRAYNAANAFLPTDVQANVSSPYFGSFYNSEYRQFRLQVRFAR